MGRLTALKDKQTQDQNLLRLSYILQIIICAVGLFCLIALCSYHRTDPGFTQTKSAHITVANVEGYVGAWIADFLFYFLGISAFFVPLILCAIIWLRSHAKYYHFNIFSGIGCAFVFLSLNGLIALHVPTYQIFPAGFGGAVGEYVAWHMVEVFNVIGATFIVNFIILWRYFD